MLNNFLKKTTALLLVLTLVFVFSACASRNDEEKNSDNGKTAETNGDNPSESQNDSEDTVSYPLTITDSFGREVTIEKEPQTIVALSPVITEVLYAFGLEDRLIARTDYCDYPEECKNIQSIGELMNPNVEMIAELEPDIAIAAAHFQQETLEKLEELGVNVVILYGEESFDGAYETLQKMGTVLNAENKAAEIVNNMKATVEEVVEKVKDLERPSVYYVVGFGEWGDYTAGRDTFIGQLIEMAGGKNAADDVEGWSYSLEKLLEKNPDYLICSKIDNHREQIKTANGYKDLDAVINDRILEIDKNMLERQGPRLADGLKAIAEFIHPGLFD